jgi:hypothetical protein
MHMRAVMLSLVLAGCGVDGGPHLDAVAPTAGTAGDAVAITGSGLCGRGDCDPLPSGLVSFGIDPQVDGEVTRWSADEIDATVPPGIVPGEILIVVTVDGQSSNGVSFEVR